MGSAYDSEGRRKTAWMMKNYLSQAPVLLPLAVPQPAGGPIVEVPATAETLENVMISIDPNTGQTALPMFLDEASLIARFPGCRYVKRAATEVLELFIDGPYDCLFFNLDGEWVSWTRELAREVLDAPETL